MQIPNPQTNKITQVGNSNILGDFYVSKNIDLTENEGVIRLGKRLLLNTATADVSQLISYPVGFAAFAGSIYTTGGTGTGPAFLNPTSSLYPSASPYSNITGSNVPAVADSALSDILVAGDVLYMTGASANIYYTTDGSTWSLPLSSGSSDSANTHMLVNYLGRTYVSRSASTIVSWDDATRTVASAGSANTLVMTNSASNTITFLRASSNRIWIGTVNTLGGKGYIYEWDGASNNFTKAYRLESQGALSCVIKDDVPYVMDSNGALLVWNGGTFKKLTQLNRRRNRMLWNATSGTNNRFIHPNGMSLINGKVCCLIDGRNLDGSATASTIEETIPSGVYEYDDGHGLVHKYSFGLSKSGGTISDYGQTRLAGVGGLAEMNIPNNSSSRNGTFLAGASYYTDASTSTSGIFYDDSNDTLQKSGYFITQKMRPTPTKSAATVTSIWRKVYVLYRQLLNSTDRLVLKGRKVEQEPTDLDITWASTTTFTTTDANMANYAIGDEVEILQGNAAGVCAHITAISLSTGTYTVTIDETVASSSATAKARLQKWVKLIEVNDQTTTWKANALSSLASNWAQFKLWMVFSGQGEVESLIPVDSATQEAI